MEELTGYVEHIVFRNAENGYTVMNFAGEEDEMTCVEMCIRDRNKHSILFCTFFILNDILNR